MIPSSHVRRPAAAGRLGTLLAAWGAAGLCWVCSAGCQMTAGAANAEGTRQFQVGQYHNAMQQFQQALVVDPRNADAYYNLAATYHRMGTLNGDQQALSQAEGLYNQCLDLEPDHTDCYRGLAVLLVQTNRAEKAFTLLERWSARSPQMPDPHVELARLYQEFGDRASATAHLTQAVAIAPHQPEQSRTFAALGMLREAAGDYSQAMVNYNRSLELNSMQPEVNNRIAALQRTAGAATGYVPAAGTRLVNAPASSVPLPQRY